jgi:hypothetical protein
MSGLHRTITGGLNTPGHARLTLWRSPSPMAQLGLPVTGNVRLAPCGWRVRGRQRGFRSAGAFRPWPPASPSAPGCVADGLAANSPKRAVSAAPSWLRTRPSDRPRAALGNGRLRRNLLIAGLCLHGSAPHPAQPGTTPPTATVLPGSAVRAIAARGGRRPAACGALERAQATNTSAVSFWAAHVVLRFRQRPNAVLRTGSALSRQALLALRCAKQLRDSHAANQERLHAYLRSQNYADCGRGIPPYWSLIIEIPLRNA